MITPNHKELIAAYRDLHAAHLEMAAQIAVRIRELEWMAAESVETSRPAPAVREPVYRSVHWSPERIEVLRRRYPCGDDLDAIFAEVNALPGPPIARDRIAIKAGSIGLKRPPKESALETRDTKRGDGSEIPVATPEPEMKAAPAAEDVPVEAPANAVEASPPRDASSQRPSVSGNPIEPSPEPKQSVRDWALERQVKRAAAAQPEPVAPAPEPKPTPAPQAPLTRMEALQRVSAAISPRKQPDSEPADLEQIRTWAAPRGIPVSNWDDLREVNRRRERLGLPPFARKFPQKGVRG